MASASPNLSIYINEVSWISDHLYRTIDSVKVAAPPDRARSPTMPLDPNRIDDAILALLSLGLHEGQRAWKTFDWDAMNRLHAKGLIEDPVNKAKSVVLTDAGLQQSALLLEQLFATQQPPGSREPGNN